MFNSDAPTRFIVENSASWTDNASAWWPEKDKPTLSRFIAMLRAMSTSGRPTYVFQHAQPSAHRTKP